MGSRASTGWFPVEKEVPFFIFKFLFYVKTTRIFDFFPLIFGCEMFSKSVLSATLIFKANLEGLYEPSGSN